MPCLEIAIIHFTPLQWFHFIKNFRELLWKYIKQNYFSKYIIDILHQLYFTSVKKCKQIVSAELVCILDSPEGTSALNLLDSVYNISMFIERPRPKSVTPIAIKRQRHQQKRLFALYSWPIENGAERVNPRTRTRRKRYWGYLIMLNIEWVFREVFGFDGCNEMYL